MKKTGRVKHSAGQQDPAGDSAVRQVLNAEESARERIAEAERKARQIVDQARNEARETERRAVDRAHRFQQIAADRTEARLDKLRARAEHEIEVIDNRPRLAALEQVTVALAREMIGLDSDGAARSPETTGSPETTRRPGTK